MAQSPGDGIRSQWHRRVAAWVISPMAKTWSGPPTTAARRRAIVVLSMVSAALLALLDTLTQQDLPSPLYVIPVVIAAVYGSGADGIVLSIEVAAGDFIESAIGRGHETILLASVGSFLLLVGSAWITSLIVGLRVALQAAERSERRSREFLDDAAHQLRTPLMGLGASAEALVMSGAPAHLEAVVFNIANDARRIGRLTSSLLRLARIDAGDPRAPASSVDLVERCQRQADALRAARPDLDVVITVPSRARGAAWLDGDEIDEALANLLDNAGRHAIRRVGIVLRADDDTMTLSVTDDGPGPPPGEEDRIFRRFASLDGHGGSGLGLPIARGLVERQGGTLEWRDGHFEIVLPARMAPPARG